MKSFTVAGFFKWAFILFIWMSFAGACLVLYFGYDLPDISKLEQTERRPSLTILAKDGTKLATYGDLHGEMVNIKRLPPHVVQAFLAIEDRRFYSHIGVDVLGLMRAMWVNYQAGHVVQGGSTITQQLAKNFLQSENMYGVNDRSLRRKIQEALLALWLEHKFTKDQILTIYVNRVYLGSGTFGLAAAAQHYFGKRAKDLNLYEAAVIAGLLKAPTKYSPANNPQLADERAAIVLENMAKEAYITEEAKEAALILASSALQSYKGSSIRYFTDWIVDILPTLVDGGDTDLIITTTLDPLLQALAEAKVEEVLNDMGDKANVSQMALVSMTNDGAIRAMIGGANYQQSQFNRATQAQRQTGSTFKAIVFLAALETGMSPHDTVSDAPIRIGKWTPKNYLYQSQGAVTLEEGLARSINTVTVRLAKRLGITRIKETARRLGINAPLQDDLSIALGSGEATLLELTKAYLVFAQNGWNVMPYAISDITDVRGHLIYKHNPPQIQRVIESRTVQDLNQMLTAVMTRGTGRKSALNWHCSGKTGTSQNDRDKWLIGFTRDMITGVWAGNDDNKPMNPKAGSPAARLWHLYMASIPPKTVPSIPTYVESAVEEEVAKPSSGGLLDDLIDALF